MQWQPAISTCVTRNTVADNGMTFLPSTHVPLMAHAGFTAIELCCYFANDFLWQDPEELKQLQKVCTEQAVSICSVHAPPTLHLLSSNAALRQECMDLVKRFIDLSNDLQADTLSLHLWSMEETLLQMNDRPYSVLQEIADHATQAQVTVCVETLRYPPSKIPNSELLMLLDAVQCPYLGLVLDTGHSHISNDLVGFSQQAGAYLKNLHIQDNNGIDDQHRLPGEGTIDWQRFVLDLRESKYGGPLLLEVNPPAGDVPLETYLTDCYNSLQRYFLQS